MLLIALELDEGCSGPAGFGLAGLGHSFHWQQVIGSSVVWQCRSEL
jgi:hypothetical protein